MYCGESLNGKRHGLGKFKWTEDGSVYEGFFSEDQFSGECEKQFYISIPLTLYSDLLILP